MTTAATPPRDDTVPRDDAASPSPAGSPPRFTVAIPVRNKEPHLQRSVSSALAQTIRDIEVIAVDDASTDGSAAVLAAFDDPRLTILNRSEPGPGGYAGRNLIIDRARADWIAFLDADDCWEPDHLEQLAAAVARHPDAGCVFSSRRLVLRDGSTAPDRYSRLPARQRAERLDYEAMVGVWLRTGEPPMGTSATAIRRDILQEIGGFPAGRCQRGGDKDTWLRTLAETDAVWSEPATSIYYFNTVNQVIRATAFGSTHCIASTIYQHCRLYPGRRPLLRRLLNREILDYAKSHTRESRISRAFFRDFAARLDPVGFATLVALWVLPPNTLQRAKRWLTHRPHARPADR